QQLHEQELDDAKARLKAHGRDPDSFTFKLEFMEPDPDGGGMFTVTYQIDVTNQATSKSVSFIGGIGMGWVENFEEVLKAGEFD
ncbi:MAG: hypothetical protein P8J20_01765, partial [Novosphingobium sp.]|nr:hypothetical protein [Novosphingobium sp.]